jgi:hypothetical protein
LFADCDKAVRDAELLWMGRGKLGGNGGRLTVVGFRLRPTQGDRLTARTSQVQRRMTHR